MEESEKVYKTLPTMKRFHESPGQIRAIVGPVGSGKTSAAAWDVCYYLPEFIFNEHKIKHTRWAVVRNTYRELADTTMATIFEWFPWGNHRKQENTYTLTYPEGFSVELLFRSCERAQDIDKFKSLEITGYWIDESIEVHEDIKRMLKGRIGRYPRKCPVRFGIETTNPPDVEHITYSQFKWDTPPPGPISSLKPLHNHFGFWQPPRENVANLREGYYEDLAEDYRDNQDWSSRYIEGKPGIIIKGKLVYNNFKRDLHVAEQPLIWAEGPLMRGWDNSGNCPAAVVLQMPRPRHIQVLREFHTDKMGMVDFATWVKAECAVAYPNAQWKDWGDPAGENQYSKKDGGFTSNAELMRTESGIDVKPSENNWATRREAVEKQLGIIDGLLIDASCIRLINGFMGGYCYPEIGNSGKFADIPDKNRFSHVHDGLQYVLLRLVGTVRREDQRRPEVEMDFDPLSVETRRRRPVHTPEIFGDFDPL